MINTIRSIRLVNCLKNMRESEMTLTIISIEKKMMNMTMIKFSLSFILWS